MNIKAKITVKAKGVTLVESAMFMLVFGIAVMGLFSVLQVGKEEIASLLEVRQTGRVTLTPETVNERCWKNNCWNPGFSDDVFVPFVGVRNGNRIALNPFAATRGETVPTRVCASYYYIYCTDSGCNAVRMFAIPCENGTYTVLSAGQSWGEVVVFGNGARIDVKIPTTVGNKKVNLNYSVVWPIKGAEQ